MRVAFRAGSASRRSAAAVRPVAPSSTTTVGLASCDGKGCRAPAGDESRGPRLLGGASGAAFDGDAAPRNESRAMAARAFWPTLEKLTVVAGGVDVLYFVFFLWLGVPELAWPNVSSVALYAVARLLLGQGCRMLAVALVCTEFVLHAAAGTLLLGWESGFHYQMLFLMPTIVLGVHWRRGRVLLLLSFAGYVGLGVCSDFFGPTDPIAPGALAVVRWTNVAIAYAMFAFAAVWYLRALHAAEGRIRFSALHDPVTGLANQQHFLALAAHELAHQRRTRWPVALAIVAIDLPARLGSDGAASEGVLIRVARELRSRCRAEDTLARWGPDEFVLLIADTSLEKAVAMLQRVLPAISGASMVSIGASDIRPHETLREAFVRADAALERSKAQGGDRVSVMAAPANPPGTAACASDSAQCDAM